MPPAAAHTRNQNMAVIEVSARRNKLATGVFATLTGLGAILTLWSMCSSPGNGYDHPLVAKGLFTMISLVFTCASVIPLFSTMDGVMQKAAFFLSVGGEVLILCSGLVIGFYAVNHVRYLTSWSNVYHCRVSFHAIVFVLQAVPVLVSAFPDALSMLVPLD